MTFAALTLSLARKTVPCGKRRRSSGCIWRKSSRIRSLGKSRYPVHLSKGYPIYYNVKKR